MDTFSQQFFHWEMTLQFAVQNLMCAMSQVQSLTQRNGYYFSRSVEFIGFFFGIFRSFFKILFWIFLESSPNFLGIFSLLKNFPKLFRNFKIFSVTLGFSFKQNIHPWIGGLEKRRPPPLEAAEATTRSSSFGCKVGAVKVSIKSKPWLWCCPRHPRK